MLPELLFFEAVAFSLLLLGMALARHLFLKYFPSGGDSEAVLQKVQVGEAVRVEDGAHRKRLLTDG